MSSDNKNKDLFYPVCLRIYFKNIYEKNPKEIEKILNNIIF